ncbi:MAG: hypothetical protein EAZ43_04745 [Betaproteobacteria bacterium]|nr:MAG: hypothetical protein EAZ43_04745 [Betaproteobacteria bacterium]
MKPVNPRPPAPTFPRTFRFAYCFASAAALLTLGFTSAASAQQTFTATLDGKPFESDNDGITVVPETRSGTVSISARTKGFGAYPPPKGFSDRVSIMCPLPKAPQKFSTVGSGGTCSVRWVIAGRSFTDADYKTTPNEGEFASAISGAKNGSVNFTKVVGKTIEGEFSVELVEMKTKRTVLAVGKFKGIDEQYGSKGFN